MPRYWYGYNGAESPFLLTSYTLTNVKPTCVNGTIICAIYAPNGGIHPSVLSENMQMYIANQLTTTVAQPQSPRKSKKYVYCRTLFTIG